MKKSGISLVMETPGTALFLTFFLLLYFSVLLLSPISCIQIKHHTTAAFSILSVNVDVCVTVQPLFFFPLLLFLRLCALVAHAPVTQEAWKDLLRPYRVI